MLHRLPSELLTDIFCCLSLFERVKLCCCCKALLPKGPPGCMRLSRPPRNLSYLASKPPTKFNFLTVSGVRVRGLIDLSAVDPGCLNMLDMYDDYWSRQMPWWLQYESMFKHGRHILIVRTPWVLDYTQLALCSHTMKLSFLRHVKNNKLFVHKINLLDILI